MGSHVILLTLMIKMTKTFTVTQITSKEMVDDAFCRYLMAESTNWRVNNVMDWWSINKRNFLNIANMALKYSDV